MRLYEYGKEFERLYELANSEEDTDTLSILFEELETNLSEKLENTAKITLDIDADGEKIANEIKRLQDKKRKLEANSQRLKALMLQAIKSSGQSKIKTPTFTFGTRVSESIEIDDIEALPDEFLRVKKEADKKLIKEAITSGKLISGAHLEVKENLQIR